MVFDAFYSMHFFSWLVLRRDNISQQSTWGRVKGGSPVSEHVIPTMHRARGKGWGGEEMEMGNGQRLYDIARATRLAAAIVRGSSAE